MSAEEATALIRFNTRIGMSGIHRSRLSESLPVGFGPTHLRRQPARPQIRRSASSPEPPPGPELDGAFAVAGGIQLRLPYRSDPETRKRIICGEMEYMDIHLGHVSQYVEYGFLGKMDWSLAEVTAVLEDGRLVPSSSLGSKSTWIDQAET